MTAREWLDAIEARASAAITQHEAGYDLEVEPTLDVPALVAALRAVLDLTSGWQPATMPRAIEAAITAALDPTAGREQIGETP